METPTLETERLVLSPLTEADAADVFTYASNANVARHVTWETHRTLADARAFIVWANTHLPGHHTWAIRPKPESRVAGAFDFIGVGEGEAQLGYTLAEPFWNRGLMTEAAQAAVAWGLAAYPKIRRVRACAMTENVGSHHVLKKCGFDFEKTETQILRKWPAGVEVMWFVRNR